MTRHLLVLNGLAVFASVAYHASGWGFISLFWWTHRYEAVAVPNFAQMGSATYYGLRLLEQSVTFGLPAFLFVSGFFIAFAAGRDAVHLGWGKVGIRVKTLVIPYILWSIAIFAGRGLEGATDTSAGYFKQLILGRAADPYYYIPLITQLYFLSPLVVGWVKRHWKAALVVAALIQLTIQLARYPVLLGMNVGEASWILRRAPSWFFPHMLFWFIFGMVAGFQLPALRDWLARWKPVLPWVTVVLGLMALLEWEALLAFSGKTWLRPTMTVLDTAYACAFILTFMAFAQSRIPARRQLDALGERSFGIYLVHAPVLELASRGAYHLVPLLLGHQFVFLCLLIAVGIAVPVLLMSAVNRSPVRPCYNYLFG